MLGSNYQANIIWRDAVLTASPVGFCFNWTSKQMDDFLFNWLMAGLTADHTMDREHRRH